MLLDNAVSQFVFCGHVPKLLPLLLLRVQRHGAKCVFLLHGHITAVKSLSFCSGGLALVSGGIGGLLNIWSLQVRGRTSCRAANSSTRQELVN